MTSYGVEWDTNILVFFPQRKLPINAKIKVPFLKEDKLTATLELWHPEDRKEIASDCLVSLEAQMGPFLDPNSRKFNIRDFQTLCSAFTKFWKKIIDSKKILVDGKEYDLVIYDKNGEFKDCGLTHPLPKMGIGYRQNFFEQNAVGTPQITIGIQLPYIISLFAYISDLYDKYDDKELPTITLTAVYVSYASVGYYCADHGIKDLNTISLLMLLAYYVSCTSIFLSDTRKSYMKAYFAFKIRTNLRIIYDSIGKPEKIVRDFLSSMSDKNKNITEIVSKLSQDFFSPVRGYTITDTKKSLEISPYTISGNNLGGNSKPVDVFMSWWNTELPEIQENNGTVSFVKTPKIDFGEWTIGPNNTIYIEYRAIMATLKMLSPNENFEHLTAEKFCYIVSFIMENVLDKALSVDPDIIIP